MFTYTHSPCPPPPGFTLTPPSTPPPPCPPLKPPSPPLTVPPTQTPLSQPQSSEKDAADFQRLAQTDKQDAKEIEREMNRLARLHHAVQHWRLKIANNEEEWSDRNAALRDEKDVMTRHYAKLKGQMDRFRRQQQSRLKELSRQSGAAMEALRTRIAVAERILKLAEFCRRLETEARGWGGGGCMGGCRGWC